MTFSLSLRVNGVATTAHVAERTLLVSFLRDDLRLTGTHVGCETAQCGACTVLMNGQAIKSCSILALQAEDADILTIEGLRNEDGSLHPMQEAFKANHGLQCGYCTPGMIISALALVGRNPYPSEQQVREGLDGNICRCTGYHNIVKSIVAGAQAMAARK